MSGVRKERRVVMLRFKVDRCGAECKCDGVTVIKEIKTDKSGTLAFGPIASFYPFDFLSF